MQSPVAGFLDDSLMQPHTVISNTVNTGVRVDFPSVDTESRDHLCLHTTAAECNCTAFHTVTVEC